MSADSSTNTGGTDSGANTGGPGPGGTDAGASGGDAGANRNADATPSSVDAGRPAQGGSPDRTEQAEPHGPPGRVTERAELRAGQPSTELAARQPLPESQVLDAMEAAFRDHQEGLRAEAAGYKASIEKRRAEIGELPPGDPRIGVLEAEIASLEEMIGDIPLPRPSDDEA